MAVLPAVGQVLVVTASVAMVWIAAKSLRTSHRDVATWMQMLPPRPSNEADARGKTITEVERFIRRRTVWPTGLAIAGVTILLLEGLWIAFGTTPAILPVEPVIACPAPICPAMVRNCPSART